MNRQESTGIHGDPKDSIGIPMDSHGTHRESMALGMCAGRGGQVGEKKEKATAFL